MWIYSENYMLLEHFSISERFHIANFYQDDFI